MAPFFTVYVISAKIVFSAANKSHFSHFSWWFLCEISKFVTCGRETVRTLLLLMTVSGSSPHVLAATAAVDMSLFMGRHDSPRVVHQMCWTGFNDNSSSYRTSSQKRQASI